MLSNTEVHEVHSKSCSCGWSGLCLSGYLQFYCGVYDVQRLRCRTHGRVCSHVFALLTVLKEQRARGGNEEETNSPSLPQSWGSCHRKIAIDLVPIMTVTLEKPTFKSRRRDPPTTCNLHEARCQNVHTLNDERVQRLQESLSPPPPPQKKKSNETYASHCSLTSKHWLLRCSIWQLPAISAKHTVTAAATTCTESASNVSAVSMPALPMPTKDPTAPVGLEWPIDLTERRTVGQDIDQERKLPASPHW